MKEVRDNFTKNLIISIPRKVKGMLELAGLPAGENQQFSFENGNEFYFEDKFSIRWEGDLRFPSKIFATERFSVISDLSEFISLEEEIYVAVEKHIKTDSFLKSIYK